MTPRDHDGDRRPLGRLDFLASYSPRQVRWVISRATHVGLDGQPVVLDSDLDALLLDLPQDDELRGPGG
jgi:hypothetical protein